MKAVLFACLLAIAGVAAMPRDIDAPVPTQSRWMDLWTIDFVNRVIDHVKAAGYDPLHKPHHSFETTIIQNLLFVKGYLKELHVEGLSSFHINSVTYNILMGRLDLDLSLKRVKAKFGHYEAEGRIGDRGGKGQLSGTLEIVDLRIVLDTLLRVYPGQPAYIININTVVSLKDIQANFKANWKCLTCLAPRDVSSCVNNILNVRMKELWAENDVFLNTLVAEGIREMVNRWWWW